MISSQALLLPLLAVFAESAGAELRTIEISTTEPPVRGVLKVQSSSPSGASSASAGMPMKKQPLVLLLGGFETGRAAIDLIPQPEGVALASLDYPFSLEGKWDAKTVLSRGFELRRALRAVDEGLCPFLAAVTADPRIDPDRIIAVGASFGAPYALNTAVKCGGVKALILLQGFGDAPGTLASRMRKGITKRVGSFLAGPISSFLGWLGWVSLGLESPEDSARKLSSAIPVLWIEASEDELIPEESKRALAKAFSGHPRFERQIVPGSHLRPGNLDQIRDLLQRSIQWLRSRDILKISS